MLGTIGHLLTLIAFVACGLAGFAYFWAAQHELSEWRRIARAAWGVMAGALFGLSAILFYLLFTHQFQYAYVYQYSSRDLPFGYLLSTFWAGQEGSFLLWILFTAVIGFGLMRWGRLYESPVMAVVALCQLFLISMIVGLQIGPVAIGSSPFQMLADKFPEAPMLQVPGFVPADGNGLNDLLQNYWMVIHPPTLFVGFAAMVVPFAFAVAALWKRRYTEWVRPALPWALFATAVLGVGIALGGYWAYETLSFGGYWAWDPVENSSLVPWLVGVAALHMMIVQKKGGSAHKAALLLNILAFLLVVYSTFLTRSGILGDVSVHSFVDLGLNNQLLLWIGTMAALGLALFARRYRHLPGPKEPSNVLSREFLIFSGALLLCATAGVVLLGTSAPIFGRLFRDNPSTVAVAFYNRWSLPLAVGFVFLAGLGQLFWWHKMSVERVNRVLLKPIALSVASTLLVLFLTPFAEHTVRLGLPEAQAPSTVAQAGMLDGLGAFWSSYGMGLLLLLLVFVAFFAFYGNALVMWRIGRGNPRLAGGALAHVGFALLILGVVASGAFSNAIAPRALAGTDRENFVVERGQTQAVEGYQVTYTGTERTSEGHTAYVLDVVDPRGRAFTLKPVAYQTKRDEWILHPDIHQYVEKDVYAAVSPAAMFEKQEESAGGELTLARGDSTVIGGGRFALHFVGYDTNVDAALLPPETEIAVAAVVRTSNLETGETRELRPVYLIMRDRTEQYLQNRVADWKLTLTFTGMNVDNGEVRLAVEGVPLEAKDWLVVQAYEKPFINLLWIGFLMMTAGFGLAFYRRSRDLRAGRGTAGRGTAGRGTA